MLPFLRGKWLLLRTTVLFSRCPTDGHHLLSRCQSQTYYRRVGDFSAAKPSEAPSQTLNSDAISRLFPTRDQLERDGLSGYHPPRARGPAAGVITPRAAHLRCYQWTPDSSYSAEHESHSRRRTVLPGGRGLSSALLLWLTTISVQGHIYYSFVFYTVLSSSEWRESLHLTQSHFTR